jgi:3D (Asp-Asp-Asp) domain-containing protein
MTSTIAIALTGFFVYGGYGSITPDNFVQAKSQLGPTYEASTSEAYEEPESLPTYTVSMTGYNAVAAQTDGDPRTTASGAYSNPEIIAARSVDLADELPFGTVISVMPATTTPNCGYGFIADEIGLRVIGDSMASRMRNKIDILFDEDETVHAQEGKLRNPARALGYCKNVQIAVVGHVDIRHIPKTQSELAALINGTGGKDLAINK